MSNSEDDLTADASEHPKESAESTDGPDVLDWDACIETPPSRPSGKVKVRLRFRGRGKPIPLDVSDEDGSREAS